MRRNTNVDDLTSRVSQLGLQGREAAPPQSNGHNYFVTRGEQTHVQDAWARAATETLGVKGATVKAFKPQRIAPDQPGQPSCHAPAPAPPSPPSTPTLKAPWVSTTTPPMSPSVSSVSSVTTSPTSAGSTSTGTTSPSSTHTRSSKWPPPPSSNSAPGEPGTIYTEDHVYVVIRGYVPGVYTRQGAWEQMVGIEDARYFVRETQEDAQDAFRRAVWERKVRAVGLENAYERSMIVNAEIAAINARRSGQSDPPTSTHTPPPTQAPPTAPAPAPLPEQHVQYTSAGYTPRQAAADARDGWHAVFVGAQPGVYQTWYESPPLSPFVHSPKVSVREEAQPLVNRVPKNIHNKFPTRADADRALEIAAAEGLVHQRFPRPPRG
ncbi:hypothetical protein BV25DRAFT_1922519 [Artomyces pyxidatus]|uniref:Uncharacterized protein n=1 Tax=Artomyces pyxidatus TaxID=48021 RepID=A0ACB8SF41_9AGAM|nr:hypothetical protein BV25DRAFT_1922519 [Artomyces pyxidatus]